jgi:hypothetical protein
VITRSLVCVCVKKRETDSENQVDSIRRATKVPATADASALVEHEQLKPLLSRKLTEADLLRQRLILRAPELAKDMEGLRLGLVAKINLPVEFNDLPMMGAKLRFQIDLVDRDIAILVSAHAHARAAFCAN